MHLCIKEFINYFVSVISNSVLEYIKVIIVAIKKEDTQAFTVKFPKSLTEEIDQICAKHYITRTSWLIRAARELLEKDRMRNTNDIIAKIASKEH